MTCQREKELLEQIEQTGQMYKVSALQLIKEGKRISELESLNAALCRDSAGFVQARDALAAKNQALLEALELLYSWANNWDSEFMNDPEWKDRDFEIIQNAIMPDLSADILRARDVRVIAELLYMLADGQDAFDGGTGLLPFELRKIAEEMEQAK